MGSQYEPPHENISRLDSRSRRSVSLVTQDIHIQRLILRSGSTATIVRIPYIKQLAQDDFLYSTTDVAIWSTVEPGIGLTASSLATLRPLFRTFFSRSKLFGSSTQNRSGSQGWPSSGKGYFRSGTSVRGGEELGLRRDIGKGVGITTTIKSTSAGDDESGNSDRIKRSGSERVLKRNESQSYLKDDSSEEFLPVQNPTGDWGVRKTTEVRTSEERQAGMAGTRSGSTL
jgi:hypothetical protein